MTTILTPRALHSLWGGFSFVSFFDGPTGLSENPTQAIEGALAAK